MCIEGIQTKATHWCCLQGPISMAAALWVVAQLHWLGWAYLLEFQGMSVFLGVWLAGLLFLAANTALICQLMLVFKPATSFRTHMLKFAIQRTL